MTDKNYMTYFICTYFSAQGSVSINIASLTCHTKASSSHCSKKKISPVHSPEIPFNILIHLYIPNGSGVHCVHRIYEWHQLLECNWMEPYINQWMFA